MAVWNAEGKIGKWRTDLLSRIEQAEKARANPPAQPRAPGGSRQRRILAQQRELEELRQEIAELKRFLIEVGQQ